MTPLSGLTFARACAGALAAGAFALPAAPAFAITIAVPTAAADAAVDVFFSPGANTDRAIAAAIQVATTRVWLAGYSFTSAPIAKALHQAHERKVDVRVVLDRSQATANYSSATYFYNQGVPLKIDARYPIMHHKFMVIDGDVVGFGSMNLPRPAHTRTRKTSICSGAGRRSPKPMRVNSSGSNKNP